jgi:hypothetical protein
LSVVWGESWIGTGASGIPLLLEANRDKERKRDRGDGIELTKEPSHLHHLNPRVVPPHRRR